jgi:hypothetical protein
MGPTQTSLSTIIGEGGFAGKRCVKITQASSSPEPGTDLGRLSVGSSGGKEKLAQEQSSKKMMARKL